MVDDHQPSGETRRLEGKIDDLGEALFASIKEISKTLHAIQLDLEVKLARMGERQDILEGLHGKLIVVGKLETGLEVVKTRVDSQDVRVTRLVNRIQWAAGVAITLAGIVAAMWKTGTP